MSTTIRIVLIIVSALTMFYTMQKMRKSQMEITDTFYWLVISVGLVVLSLFPQIATFFARLLGFESTFNFVYVSVIFLIILKLFSLSVEVSQLKIKLRRLVQEYAVSENEKNKSAETECSSITDR